jgi:hypothetical protein
MAEKVFKIRFVDRHAKTFTLEVRLLTHADPRQDVGTWKRLQGNLRFARGNCDYGERGDLCIYPPGKIAERFAIGMRVTWFWDIYGNRLKSGEAYLRHDWAITTTGGQLLWRVVG